MPDSQKTLILNTISEIGVKKPGLLYNKIYDHVKQHGRSGVEEEMMGDPFEKYFDNKVTIHRTNEACEACQG